MYKFIEGTGWPNDKKELLIGVLGDSDIQPEMEKMIQTLNDAKLRIKKIGLGEVNGCDVIFLPSSQDAQFTSVKDKTNGKSILLVTESAELAEKGAGISFLKDGTKLSFTINKTSLETRNLKVSGSLTSMGKQI